MATKQQSARNKRKIILFVIEIVVILVMLLFLKELLDRTENGPKTPGGEEGKVLSMKDGKEKNDLLEVHEEVQKEKEEGSMKNYMNIALFGVDAKTDNELYKNSNSDSIMIASINKSTGDIKLVSVYRDTYLNVGTSYRKCNAAYFLGGAEQAVKMLNMNLDMDITDFITIGYQGLIDVIDGLGGVYIDVDSEELKHINNYQISIAEVIKSDYKPVTETGKQLLNGLQATAYCRIRYTAGDDFKRTARQREVIKAIEEQAKKADYTKLANVFDTVIGNVYTSIDSSDILDLLANIANYRIVDEGGFPEETMRTTGNIGAKGSCVVPVDLEQNVVWLHQFLFDDESYTVTESVKEYSGQIKKDTSEYINRIN